MKPVIIKQSRGLGDILFCQKIAHQFIQKGHPVIWPVFDPYYHIKEYLTGPLFVSEDVDFPFKQHYGACGYGQQMDTEECTVICLDGASSPGLGTMRSKYKLVDIDYRDWDDFLNIKRNKEREQQLIDRLNLPEKFILVNKYFGTPPMCLSVNERVAPVTDLPIVQLDLTLGRPFDWMGVFERAVEIHSVETAFCYIIQAMKRTEKVFIYPRWLNADDTRVDFDYCRDYFKREWTFYGEQIHL